MPKSHTLACSGECGCTLPLPEGGTPVSLDGKSGIGLSANAILAHRAADAWLLVVTSKEGVTLGFCSMECLRDWSSSQASGIPLAIEKQMRAMADAMIDSIGPSRPAPPTDRRN